MFNRFLQNTRKPTGILGRMMLRGMNAGHAPLAKWGFSHLRPADYPHILDVGCGGGANIAHMLKEAPNSRVDGLDYSEESVAFSKKTNRRALGKRCTIRQGDVAHLPYSDNSLNLVTAFETVYFWPSPDRAFSEIHRALRPGGAFFICCESDDADDTKWTGRIKGMTVHRAADLKTRLLAAGFQNVKIHRNDSGWIAIMAAR